MQTPGNPSQAAIAWALQASAVAVLSDASELWQLQMSRHETCLTHVASRCCTGMLHGLNRTSGGSLAVLFEGT